MSLIWLDRDGRTHTPPAEWAGDMLAGHRDGAWTWRLLDARTRHILSELPAAQTDDDGDPATAGVLAAGSSLEMSVTAPTRWTGQMTWVGPLGDMPAWLDRLVQPVYTATLDDGSSVSWTFTPLLPATPRLTYQESGWVTAAVDLYDRTLILRREELWWDMFRDAGTNPVQYVVAVTGRVTGQRAVIPATTATLRARTWFEIGTDRLTVANQLLEGVGYYSLYADPEGTLRSGPYVEPMSRPVAWTFRDGAASIYRPDFTLERDEFHAANRVTLTSREDADHPALRARAVNVDPNHPLSYPSRGNVWITRTETGVDAVDQATLDQHARRILAEEMAPASTLELEHAPVPLAANDRVEFARDSHGLALTGVVRGMRVPCEPGALWRTTVMEVTT